MAPRKLKDASTAPLSLYTGPSNDLLSTVRPPKGYRLGRVLCFSYSLDASVAIALLCSAFGLSDRDLDPQLPVTGLNKLDQLRFLKSILRKSLFVIQHSEEPIRGITDVRDDVSAGLQDRVFTIQRPRDRFMEHSSDWINFHPKLVLAEFNRREDSWLRAYIGSKNLSLGAALESGVQIEIPPSKERAQGTSLPSAGFAEPLADFLKAIKREGFNLSRNRSTDVDRHVAEIDLWIGKLIAVRGRPIYTNELIKSLDLHAQFPGSSPLSTPLAKDLNVSAKTIIVSPWCDVDTTRWLLTFKPRNENLALWTLDSERAHLAPLKSQAHKVQTDATSNLYDFDTKGEVVAQDRDLRHHAKLVAIDHRGANGILWLGSANWTKPGIGLDFSGKENFELMVRLGLKTNASALLGDVDTVPIDETDETADTEEEPLTKQQRLQRLLHWFRIDWSKYPNELSLQLLVRPPGKGYGDLGFKTIRIEVKKTFESDEYQLFAEIPWRLLASGTAIKIESRTSFPKNIVLDATIRLSTDLGDRAGLVHCLVPVPDRIAERRAEELKSRMNASVEDGLERLISIQEGFKRRLSRPTEVGIGEGNGTRIDHYLRTLRLEKVFLRLTTDLDSFEENIEDVTNIQDLLDAEIRKDRSRAELIDLSESLRIIVSEALSIRRKQREKHAS